MATTAIGNKILMILFFFTFINGASCHKVIEAFQLRKQPGICICVCVCIYTHTTLGYYE